MSSENVVIYAYLEHILVGAQSTNHQNQLFPSLVHKWHILVFISLFKVFYGIFTQIFTIDPVLYYSSIHYFLWVYLVQLQPFIEAYWFFSTALHKLVLFFISPMSRCNLLHAQGIYYLCVYLYKAVYNSCYPSIQAYGLRHQILYIGIYSTAVSNAFGICLCLIKQLCCHMQVNTCIALYKGFYSLACIIFLDPTHALLFMHAYLLSASICRFISTKLALRRIIGKRDTNMAVMSNYPHLAFQVVIA